MSEMGSELRELFEEFFGRGGSGGGLLARRSDGDVVSATLYEKLNRALTDATNSAKNFSKASKLEANEKVALNALQVKNKDTLKKLNDDAKAGRITSEQYRREVQKLTRNFEDLEETVGKLDDVHSKELKKELEKATKNAKYLEQIEELKKSFSVLNTTTKGIAGTFAVINKVGSAVGSTIKNLQGNASGMEIASGLMTAGIDMANGAVQVTTGAIGNLGSIASNSTNPRVKALGIVAGVAAPLIGGLADSASKLAKFGVEVLSKEVEKSIKAFQESTAAGAMFADGVSGLRNAAADSGLTIDQFSGVLKAHSGIIAQSGLGVAEGAKTMGRVAKDMKNSGVQDQLLKLGYSFEEQAGLIAETTANMRRTAGGKSTDAEIQQQTAKYAENLRIVAAITGEDAKRKTEETRQQNQVMAFQAELAKKTPAQRAAIDLAMATMTEQEKKNFRERAVLGVVINKEGAIYEATLAGARQKGEAALDLWNKNELTAEANSRLNAQFGDQIKQSALNNTAFNLAGMVVGGTVGEVSKASLDLVNQSNTFSAEAVAKGIESVNAQKNTLDKATEEFMGVTSAAQGLKVALERELTGAIGHFAEVSKEILTSLQDQLKKLGISSAGEKVERAGSTLGKEVESIGSDIGKVGIGITALGAVLTGAGFLASLTGIGALAGAPMMAAGATMMGGGLSVGGAGAAMEIGGNIASSSGYRVGGIATGPTSGFLEKLHGTELVLPLDGGNQLDTTSKGYAELMKIIGTPQSPGAVTTSKSVVGESAFTAKPIEINLADSSKQSLDSFTSVKSFGLDLSQSSKESFDTFKLMKIPEISFAKDSEALIRELNERPIEKFQPSVSEGLTSQGFKDVLTTLTGPLGLIAKLPFGKLTDTLTSVFTIDKKQEQISETKNISDSVSSTVSNVFTTYMGGMPAMFDNLFGTTKNLANATDSHQLDFAESFTSQLRGILSEINNTEKEDSTVELIAAIESLKTLLEGMKLDSSESDDKTNIISTNRVVDQLATINQSLTAQLAVFEESAVQQRNLLEIANDHKNISRDLFRAST